MRSLDSETQIAWQATILIRLMVGAVFFTEGLQKFLYPALRGAGRFEKIGFANPEFWGYFVASFETVCGALVLLGAWTRFAAIPLLVIMLVAIVTTKLPILFGQGFGPFGVRELPFYGFLSMAHEMRTDWAMLLGSTYLTLVGGGPWSLDSTLGERQRRRWNHL